jgi:hypothetical protein
MHCVAVSTDTGTVPMGATSFRGAARRMMVEHPAQHFEVGCKRRQIISAPACAPSQPFCYYRSSTRSTVQTVSRPSLKITRHDDRQPPGDVGFEVWNPITASYEPMASLDAGLCRLSDLAEFLWLMWLRNEPEQTSLKDAPNPAEDDTEWAELRVHVQAIRVYETRSCNQHVWTWVMNQSAAVETISNEVRYVPP